MIGIVGIRPKMLFLVRLVQNIMKYASYLQVKAVLRGELPPFSSAYVEAVMAVVNLQGAQAAKLKYTLLGKRVPLLAATRMHFQALVLQFLKEQEPVILIEEVCCGAFHMITRQRSNNIFGKNSSTAFGKNSSSMPRQRGISSFSAAAMPQVFDQMWGARNVLCRRHNLHIQWNWKRQCR